MDWTAASVIISAIGIIATIVIAANSANNELRHNRFLQERDIAIRLLHENEFDPEWLAAKRVFFEKLIFETGLIGKVFRAENSVLKMNWRLKKKHSGIRLLWYLTTWNSSVLRS